MLLSKLVLFSLHYIHFYKNDKNVNICICRSKMYFSRFCNEIHYTSLNQRYEQINKTKIS